VRRSQLSHFASCVLSGLLVAGFAGADEPGPALLAAKVEGYLGAAILDGSGFDNEAEVDAGGTGSLTALFGPAYFQVDVFGDHTSFDPDARSVGLGAHLGISDPELYAVGASFTYQNLEWKPFKDDFLRGGGEAELFLGPVTLGVHGGYIDVDNANVDGFYARGLVRWYVTPDLKLEGAGGVVDIDSDSVPQARALVEFRPEGWPVGFFTRWEGAFDSGLDQHFAVLGFRLYLEGLGLEAPRSLRSTDRIYFRDSCLGFQLGARMC
jgi:hypothetical protein